MKITPNRDLGLFVKQVTDKKNPGGQQSSREDLRDQNRNEDEDKNKETSEFKIEVDRAIGEFENDDVAQRSGIHAIREGDGPGLKVVLKDGSGAIVRQMTGKEFLDLRKNVADPKHVQGRLLDRKL